MGISFKTSEQDRQQLDLRDNPPEYESGFESGGDLGFDDLNFDDFESGGFESGGDIFGLEGSTGSTEANGGIGQSNVFGTFNTLESGGQTSNVFGNYNQTGVNSPFGVQSVQGVNQQPPKEDMTEKLYNESVDAAKSLFSICKDMFSSVRLRNADDLAFFGNSLIKTGFFLLIGAIAVGIFGSIVDLRFIKFTNMPLSVALSSIVVMSTGLISLGTALIGIVYSNGASGDDNSIGDLPDAALELGFDDATDLVSDSIGDQLDSLFDDDDLFDDLDDNFFDEDPEAETIPEEDTGVYMPTDEPEELPPIDYAQFMESVRENQVITREILLNTFIPLLPVNTPKFADKKVLTSGTEYTNLRTCMLKALSRVIGTDIQSVESDVTKIEDSFFSYTITMTRINKCNKLDDIAREVERYLRSDSKDTSVNASVTIEGDEYKIVVTKGVSAIVTFGDLFKQDYVEKFYRNKKNQLPIVQGIDELGHVMLEDAKSIDSMIIAGQPRSGKSWYVLSILMSLMLFNSPEDVQLLIVDPKESNLFRTLALMPHVCGLHDHKRILQIFDDIIENEAPRRKQLFKDHRVDDIWAFREKGFKLPVLMIVIDEYVTVKESLGDDYKELDSKLRTIITQLPSLGIRVLIVPHRATGVVDKTNRGMFAFAAAVRSVNDDVVDTLNIKKWTRPLVHPGDIAVRNREAPEGAYVRGAALTISDARNSDFIENAAKAFYKMGVELPDMSTLQIGYNRDEQYVKEQLTGGSNLVQFSADTILRDL